MTKALGNKVGIISSNLKENVPLLSEEEMLKVCEKYPKLSLAWMESLSEVEFALTWDELIFKSILRAFESEKVKFESDEDKYKMLYIFGYSLIAFRIYHLIEMFGEIYDLINRIDWDKINEAIEKEKSKRI